MGSLVPGEPGRDAMIARACTAGYKISGLISGRRQRYGSNG